MLGSYQFDWAEVKAMNGGDNLFCIWDKEFFDKKEITIGE